MVFNSVSFLIGGHDIQHCVVLMGGHDIQQCVVLIGGHDIQQCVVKFVLYIFRAYTWIDFTNQIGA